MIALVTADTVELRLPTVEWTSGRMIPRKRVASGNDSTSLTCRTSSSHQRSRRRGQRESANSLPAATAGASSDRTSHQQRCLPQLRVTLRRRRLLTEACLAP